MTKLKPCPFCGSRNVHTVKDMYGHWMVECWERGCRASYGNHKYPYIAESDAIDGWNRRAVDKPKVPFGITINGDVGYQCPHCMAVYGAGCLPEDKICEFCHKDMRVKE